MARSNDFSRTSVFSGDFLDHGPIQHSTENIHLETRLRETVSELNAVNLDNEKFCQDISKYKSKVNTLEEELDKAKIDVAAAKKEKNKIKNELEEVNQNYESQQKTHEKEILALKKSYQMKFSSSLKELENSSAITRSDLENQISKKNLQIDNLKQDFEEAQSKLLEDSKKLAKAQE